MKENNIISIIVPVFNSEKTLIRCIESIINQSYRFLEIILINDGSTDSSGEICELYEKREKRIRYFTQLNKGVSAARNFAIQQATGKYIQFVDSDDYIDEKFCEIMVNILKNNDCKLAICGYKYEDDFGNIHKEIDYDDIIFDNIYEMRGHFEKIYCKNLINICCNKLYLKNYIIENFDENKCLGEDLIFNLTYFNNIIIKKGKIGCINAKLYYYIKNNKSLTSTFREDRIDVGLKLTQSVHEFCRDVFENNYCIKCINTPLAYLIQETIDMCIKCNNLNEYIKIKKIKKIVKNNNITQICTNVQLNKIHSIISNFLIKNKQYYFVYFYHKLKFFVKKVR